MCKREEELLDLLVILCTLKSLISESLLVTLKGQFLTAVVGHILSERLLTVSHQARIDFKLVVEVNHNLLLGLEGSLIDRSPPVAIIAVFVIFCTTGVEAMTEFVAEGGGDGVDRSLAQVVVETWLADPCWQV